MRNRTIAIVVLTAVILVAVGSVYLILNHSRYSARQNFSVGNGVLVSGSQVPNDIKSTVAKTASPSLPHMQVLGSTLQLTPAGHLPAPLTLRFRLNRKVAASDVVFVGTAERQGDPWTLLEAHVTADGWYAEAQTDHLSLWDTFLFDLKEAANDFKKGFIDAVSGDMTTTADKPHCDNEDQARQDNYSINSSAKDTLYWCFGIENGERVLKIVNRMRYPLEVGYPGFTLKHQAIPNFDLDQLARFVTDKTITLFPFEEAEFTVNLPDGGGQAAIKTTYAGYAQGLYQLEVGLSTSLLFLGEVKAAVGSKDLFLAAANKMNVLLKIKSCANVFFDLRPGSVIQGCFDHNDVLAAFGWKGLILAALMVFGPIIEFFHSEFDVIHDQITGGSEYEVLVTRTNQVTITFTSSNCNGCVITAYATASRSVAGKATISNGRAVLTVPKETTKGMVFVVGTPHYYMPNAIKAIALGYAGVPAGTSLSAAQMAKQPSGSFCWAGTTSPTVTIELGVYIFPDPELAQAFGGAQGNDSISLWASPTLPTMGAMMHTYHGGLGYQDGPFCSS